MPDGKPLGTYKPIREQSGIFFFFFLNQIRQKFTFEHRYARQRHGFADVSRGLERSLRDIKNGKPPDAIRGGS